jgi:heptosyltransferase-2
VRILRKKFPNAQIDFLVYSQYKSILEFNLNISNLLNLNKNASADEISNYKNELLSKNGTYDVIFDLHNNPKSKFFSESLGKEIFRIDKRRLFKLGLVWLKKGKNQPYKLIHEIYLDTLRKYDVIDDNLGLEFWLQSDKIDNKYFPHSKSFSKKRKLDIIIAPAAHYKTKMWSVQYYIDLIELLKPFAKSIKLIGGKDDKNIADKIYSHHDFGINLCGITNLTQTAEEIDKSDLVITNDTGVMHIAAARQIPVAVFFGSTVKEFGFEPFRVPNILLETELSCRPCSHIGRNFCPLGHFNCMNNIKPDFAFNKIIEFLKPIYGL